MRLYQFLVSVTFLIGIAHCFFFEFVNPAPFGTALDQSESAPEEQSEPVSAIEESAAAVLEAQVEDIQARRDVTKNLNYKCGPKWGKCPEDTCCSGSGKSLARPTHNVLTRTGYQVTVAHPSCTAAPLTA